MYQECNEEKYHSGYMFDFNTWTFKKSSDCEKYF